MNEDEAREHLESMQAKLNDLIATTNDSDEGNE